MRISKNVCIVASGDSGLSLTGPGDCTVYLVDGGSSCALIDAGFTLEPEQIVRNIEDDGQGLCLRCHGGLRVHRRPEGAVGGCGQGCGAVPAGLPCAFRPCDASCRRQHDRSRRCTAECDILAWTLQRALLLPHGRRPVLWGCDERRRQNRATGHMGLRHTGVSGHRTEASWPACQRVLPRSRSLFAREGVSSFRCGDGTHRPALASSKFNRRIGCLSIISRSGSVFCGT